MAKKKIEAPEEGTIESTGVLNLEHPTINIKDASLKDKIETLKGLRTFIGLDKIKTDGFFGNEDLTSFMILSLDVLNERLENIEGR